MKLVLMRSVMVSRLHNRCTVWTRIVFSQVKNTKISNADNMWYVHNKKTQPWGEAFRQHVTNGYKLCIYCTKNCLSGFRNTATSWSLVKENGVLLHHLVACPANTQIPDIFPSSMWKSRAHKIRRATNQTNHQTFPLTKPVPTINKKEFIRGEIIRASLFNQRSEVNEGLLSWQSSLCIQTRNSSHDLQVTILIHSSLWFSMNI